MNIYNYLLEAQSFYYSEPIDFGFYMFTTQKFDKRKLRETKSNFIWGVKDPSGSVLLDEEYGGYIDFSNKHILKVRKESGYNFYDINKNRFILKDFIPSASFIDEINGMCYFNTNSGLINESGKILSKSKYTKIIKTKDGLLAYNNYGSSEVANLDTGKTIDLQKKGGSSYGKTINTSIYGVYNLTSGVCFIVNHKSTYNSDREKKWFDDYQFIDADGNQYSTGLYQPGSEKVCFTSDSVYCLGTGSSVKSFPENKDIPCKNMYNLITIDNHPFAFGAGITDLISGKKIFNEFIWKTIGEYFISGNPGKNGIVDLFGKVMIPDNMILGDIEKIFNEDETLNGRKAIAYIFGG
jgi:hypothetical protein